MLWVVVTDEDCCVVLVVELEGVVLDEVDAVELVEIVEVEVAGDVVDDEPVVFVLAGCGGAERRK